MKIEEKEPVKIIKMASCKHCDGTGVVMSKETPRYFTCAVCAGKGKVKVTKTISTVVETI